MKTKTLNAFRPSGYTLVNGAAVPKAIIETLVFDGKGTLTFADAGTVSFDLHVHPAGKSVAMLQTNAGNVMQGEAVRVLSLGAWAG
jgi:hypothetical protein